MTWERTFILQRREILLELQFDTRDRSSIPFEFFLPVRCVLVRNRPNCVRVGSYFSQHLTADLQRHLLGSFFLQGTEQYTTAHMEGYFFSLLSFRTDEKKRAAVFIISRPTPVYRRDGKEKIVVLSLHTRARVRLFIHHRPKWKQLKRIKHRIPVNVQWAQKAVCSPHFCQNGYPYWDNVE